MSIYDYKITSSNGSEISMSEYRGKVLLIVNTASKCGFTPQYTELQELYKQYGKQGLEILAFPCNQFANQEPGSNSEIASFCSLNYGVSFPVMGKIDVNGQNAHLLFQYLEEKAPGIFGKAVKWNFTKFLVDRTGSSIERHAPTTSPARLKSRIEKLLKT
jgi:glutathione peroxidase